MSVKTKTDIKDRFVIIMAGGRGERFWPLSREQTPKQLLAILGKKSFLQEAVERVLPLVPAKNIFIITNEVQAPLVRKQLPKLPKDNIVAEPVGRDTCAAVTLGAALVGARSTTGVMAVLPADHVIPDAKKFQQILSDAFDMAAQGQAIVTIGIKPTEPATGYGYIQTGNELPKLAGVKTKTTFYKAERFVEKPNFETALEYVNSGQYRWNAGMFVWSFITVTNGLEKHQPEMFAACQRWFKVANHPAKLAKMLAKEYPEIKKVSIDYALMEKAQNVIVADGDFEWDDLGAWPALARHIKQDPEGNAAMADFIHVDAARNIIYDGRTKNKTPVAVVGLRDSILVLTDDAVLLAHKSQAQKVKEVVKKMSEDARLKKLI
jgi:mannose-1-phosphate guanylyltransferase